MRPLFFALALSACTATPHSTTTPREARGIAVPADARSVVYHLDGGTITAIGDDFANAHAVEGIACFNLPDGTRSIEPHTRGSSGRITFSPQRCNAVFYDRVSYDPN